MEEKMKKNIVKGISIALIAGGLGFGLGKLSGKSPDKNLRKTQEKTFTAKKEDKRIKENRRIIHSCNHPSTQYEIVTRYDGHETTYILDCAEKDQIFAKKEPILFYPQNYQMWQEKMVFTGW